MKESTLKGFCLRQFGLVSFVWGDDLEKPENVEYCKKDILVDGIVYDRYLLELFQDRPSICVIEHPNGINDPTTF
jgi:hypothetical protein